jgi:hypothetical protein
MAHARASDLHRCLTELAENTTDRTAATIRLSLAADGTAIGLLVGVVLPVRAANRRCVTCDQAASASLSLSSK